MQLSDKEIMDFQKKIFDWYAKHQRDLPWRKTRDPYAILISEVMSQQTQITRVVAKYHEWMKRFPTVEHLAGASISEVLGLWSGLGYNRRALNLKKTAEIIYQEYQGAFPQTEKKLLVLPGIGNYTARALLCFAFDQQVAVIDTNVRKVILTQFTVEEKDIATIAEVLLPIGKAYSWNQALMDYAAAVLKKEKIPIPKQSKFIGSHRYYRGQVLKMLLQKRQIAVDEIGLLINQNYHVNDEEWLQKLLKELEKEGFIRVKKNLIMLVS
jgi:A/G-specific adenine glycosylase